MLISTTDTDTSSQIPPILTALSRCLDALDKSLQDEAATAQQLRSRRFACALVDTLGRCCSTLPAELLTSTCPVDIVDAAAWLSQWYSDAATRARGESGSNSVLLDASGQRNGHGDFGAAIADEYEMRSAAWKEVASLRWLSREERAAIRQDRLDLGETRANTKGALVVWTHTTATLISQLPSLQSRQQVATAMQLMSVFSSEAALLAQAAVSEL